MQEKQLAAMRGDTGSRYTQSRRWGVALDLLGKLECDAMAPIAPFCRVGKFGRSLSLSRAAQPHHAGPFRMPTHP